jgi:hypothetical protein
MSNNAISSLVKKVQDGTSTPEEELALLQIMNNSVKVFREFIKEIKVEQLKETIAR